MTLLTVADKPKPPKTHKAFQYVGGNYRTVVDYVLGDNDTANMDIRTGKLTINRSDGYDRTVFWVKASITDWFVYTEGYWRHMSNEDFHKSYTT